MRVAIPNIVRSTRGETLLSRLRYDSSIRRSIIQDLSLVAAVSKFQDDAAMRNYGGRRC